MLIDVLYLKGKVDPKGNPARYKDVTVDPGDIFQSTSAIWRFQNSTQCKSDRCLYRSCPDEVHRDQVFWKTQLPYMQTPLFRGSQRGNFDSESVAAVTDSGKLRQLLFNKPCDSLCLLSEMLPLLQTVTF